MDLTNKVELLGQIIGDFIFDHEKDGEAFFRNCIKIKRRSKANDLIQIVVSKKYIDLNKDYKGKIFEVSGQFRSVDMYCGEKRKVDLFVYVDFIQEVDFYFMKNFIELQGYICKEPTYRKTICSDREISDVFLAVNRTDEKNCDYIPCIVWGRDARYVSELPVGTKVKVIGRIQSREYCRQGEDEVRIAYEVSVGKIEEWEEE